MPGFAGATSLRGFPAEISPQAGRASKPGKYELLYVQAVSTRPRRRSPIDVTPALATLEAVENGRWAVELESPGPDRTAIWTSSPWCRPRRPKVPGLRVHQEWVTGARFALPTSRAPSSSLCRRGVEPGVATHICRARGNCRDPNGGQKPPPARGCRSNGRPKQQRQLHHRRVGQRRTPHTRTTWTRGATAGPAGALTLPIEGGAYGCVSAQATRCSRDARSK